MEEDNLVTSQDKESCYTGYQHHDTALSMRQYSHHGSDVTQTLQVLHYTTLVCWFHPGEAPCRHAGLTLQVRRQLIKLPPRQAPDEPRALLLLFLLRDDAHPPTDRQGCPFVVTWRRK